MVNLSNSIITIDVGGGGAKISANVSVVETQIGELVQTFIFGGSQYPLIRELVVTFIYET